MHTYEWQRKYEVGYAPVDNQHKQLLSSINRLISYQREPKDILISLLDEVIKYADFHFASEYNLMKISRFPQAESHINEHKVLLKQLINHRDKTATDISNLQETVNFLVHWFVHHTVKEDKELADHLNKTLVPIE